MPIHQEHSLVRYDPHQRAVGHRTDGHLRLATAPTPPRSDDSTPGALAANQLRQSPAYSIYSPRRTMAAAAATVTGRVVDIFV